MHLTIHTDAAIEGHTNKGGLGISAVAFVIVDSEGEVLRKAGLVMEGKTTISEAEYGAVLLGLYNARMLGAKTVDLYSDSQLIVRQITGQYQCKAAHLKPYLEEVREEISQFDRVNVTWIPREQNTIADEESKRVLSSRGGDA